MIKKYKWWIILVVVVIGFYLYVNTDIKIEPAGIDNQNLTAGAANSSKGSSGGKGASGASFGTRAGNAGWNVNISVFGVSLYNNAKK